jgi:hypothetical protein
MSVDLELRSDDRYSHPLPLDAVVSALGRVRAVPAGPGFYVLNTPAGLRLEIDVVSKGAESVVSAVGLGFRDDPADEVLALAFRLADEFGWKVFDPQRGGYIPRDELTEPVGIGVAAKRVQAALRRLGPTWIMKRLLWHLAPRSRSAVGACLLVGFLTADTVNRLWAGRAPFFLPPGVWAAAAVVGLGLLAHASLSALSDAVTETERSSTTGGQSVVPTGTSGPLSPPSDEGAAR